MTAMKSAYPVPVDELLPQARQLAEELGQVPSRNRLMSELKIGAPKARVLLEQLQPVPADNIDESTSARLHLVSQSQTSNQEEPGSSATTKPNNAGPDADESEELSATTKSETSSETPGSSPATETSHPNTSTVWPSPGSEPVSTSADPGTPPTGSPTHQPVRSWPVLLLALPAFVAIWSGWVGLGELTGFGIVHPLPGIADGFALNTAITLPIGVETYAAYALRVWLSGQVPDRARNFAKYSALGSLVLGALGQVAFHLMTAAGMAQAPWWITTLVSCLPVAVLGMGAALTHLLHHTDDRLEVA